jgi:energy-coupling factor transport system ATP-binding protein
MIEANNVGYRFPSAKTLSSGPIDLVVPEGQFVLVTGQTGSGKSTLLRLLAGLVQRHGQGDVVGSALIDGEDAGTMRATDRASKLAFVTQTPEDQLICQTVIDEVCFGLESTETPILEVTKLGSQWLARVGLDVDGDRHSSKLSGGQQQRLVLASAMAGGAEVLLLDEPLAQLDPPGATDLVHQLREMATEGCTVVVVEHRLDELWSAADRVVLIDAGRVVVDGPPTDVDLEPFRDLGLSLPPLVDLNDQLAARGLTIDDLSFSEKDLTDEAAIPSDRPIVLSLPALQHKYDGADTLALSTEPMCFRAGERVAVIGVNGSGKSTLLHQILAHGPKNQPGFSIMVPQNADLTLFNGSVLEELSFAPREAGQDEPSALKAAHAAADALGISSLLDSPPHALSKGQRVRVAVAAAMSCHPTMMVLDEPTAGQDGDQMHQMLDALALGLVDGLLIFATHDVSLALEYATRIIILEQGLVDFDGPPADATNRLKDATPWITFCHKVGVSIRHPSQFIEALDD